MHNYACNTWGARSVSPVLLDAQAVRALLMSKDTFITQRCDIDTYGLH